MRYITILITIIFYWFLLGLTLSFMYQDSFINSPSLDSNYTSVGATSNINFTTDEYTNQTTPITFINVLKTMFLFRVPKSVGMPYLMTFIISFINWILIILLGISIYRIINPLA